MYRPLCAGDLTHRLTIRVPSSSQSSTGAVVNSTSRFTTILTVWGSLVTLTGKELIAAQQLQSKIMAKATIRYRADVIALAQANASLELVFNSLPYVIEAVLPDERFADSLTLMLSAGPVQ